MPNSRKADNVLHLEIERRIFQVSELNPPSSTCLNPISVASGWRAKSPAAKRRPSGHIYFSLKTRRAR